MTIDNPLSIESERERYTTFQILQSPFCITILQQLAKKSPSLSPRSPF